MPLPEIPPQRHRRAPAAVGGDHGVVGGRGGCQWCRVTQIMNLLQLAPEIQEALLFLPRTERGRDPVREHHIRPIAATPDWRRQRGIWERLS